MEMTGKGRVLVRRGGVLNGNAHKNTKTLKTQKRGFAKKNVPLGEMKTIEEPKTLTSGGELKTSYM